MSCHDEVDETSPPRAGVSAWTAMAVLRIFMGVIFFTNGLAKLVGGNEYGFPGFSFSLIDGNGAKSILQSATEASVIPFISDLYTGLVLSNWGVFAVLLTIAELAVGLGLILGLATRLAALGGILLIAPIWLMLLPAGKYLWEYPIDLLPLVLLALVPAGRILGLDRTISSRYFKRWPF